MANRRGNRAVRNNRGLGVWEHRGKVAVAGWGQSYIDRRWDGKDFTKSCGAKSMQAIQLALEDAGLTLDDVDGLVTCDAPDTRAEQTWAPRPYFAAPYDSEDGLLMASGEWIQKQMGMKNVKYINSKAGAIWSMMPAAAQAVGDGLCEVAVAWYPMCNLEGRYGHSNPNNVDEFAPGNRAFSLPWGYQSGAMFNNLVAFMQYCKKYGRNHDGLGPLCLNLRRNGLLTPWGFYSLHEPYQLTMEDYRNGRPVEEPLVIYDCDRPIMTCAAYVFTTAERARDMKQKPVYAMSHASSAEGGRSTMFTCDEQQDRCEQLADVLLEGAGMDRKDVDVFNPYDGYLTFTQQYLEAFRWHGVGKGEAHDFYADDIRVEGPHPFKSGGGNNGTGRNRSADYSDSIQQLRGTAGPACQVTIKNGRPETAVSGFGEMMSFSISPS